MLKENISMLRSVNGVFGKIGSTEKSKIYFDKLFGY